MAGELELGQLLANALALPKTIQAGQQQSALDLALAQGYEKAGLLQPGQAQQFYGPPPLGRPGSFSGHLIANPVFQTIGTFGQLLQGILGAPPSAPRPPITALAQLNRMAQQKQYGETVQRDIAAHKTPEEIAADVAPYDPKGAVKLMTPKAPGTSLGAMIQARDRETDPGKKAQIQKEITELQRMGVERAEAQGRAGATGRLEATGPTNPLEEAFAVMGVHAGEATPAQMKEAEGLRDQIVANTQAARSQALAKAKAGTPLQVENLRSSRAILNRARAAAARALKWQESHPVLGLVAAKAGISNVLLSYAAATGDRDAAFLMNNLPTLMPRIARFLGEIRPTVLEEFRLRGGIGVERKTYQEALATFDEFLGLIDDMTPEELKGKLDQQPRPAQPAIPEESQLQASIPGQGKTRSGRRFQVQ